jgi:ribonuclease G
VSLELVIHKTDSGVDVALLRDQKLIELHQEKGGSQFQVGDVYLAKVRKVVPSLNAAFVDVGYEKDAFLHYLDLGPQFSTLSRYVKDLLNKKHQDYDLSSIKLDPDIDKNGKMPDVLSGSQTVLVQIAKEPISSKGPRLTSEVTLAGRYVVLVPFSDKVSVSQKIRDAEERERLRRLITSIKPKNFGVIVRTVASDQKVAELDQDLKDLLNKWIQITKGIAKAEMPKKVHGELDRTSSILRDMLNPDFTNIYVDHEQTAEEIKEYVKGIAPGKDAIVKSFKSKVSIFDHFGIHRQIKASFGRKVSMPSGAYLIIEHTEAMHVIDVNSGNRKGGNKAQEENALEVNLEAAEEIARVLRLRDMGGIICVDFIDMANKEYNKLLVDKLKEFMKLDRAKHTVLPPSKFGVIEITRQRVRPETDIETNEACPVCAGTGEARASILVLDEIEGELKFLCEERKPGFLLLRTHPFIAAYLTQGLFSSIKKKWAKKYKVKLQIMALTEYHLLEYAFFDKNDERMEV